MYVSFIGDMHTLHIYYNSTYVLHASECSSYIAPSMCSSVPCLGIVGLMGACWVPMILTLYRDQCVCVVTVTVSLYDVWPNAGARTNQGFTLQCMPYPE